jgi:hypothetical protein
MRVCGSRHREPRCVSGLQAEHAMGGRAQSAGRTMGGLGCGSRGLDCPTVFMGKVGAAGPAVRVSSWRGAVLAGAAQWLARLAERGWRPLSLYGVARTSEVVPAGVALSCNAATMLRVYALPVLGAGCVCGKGCMFGRRMAMTGRAMCVL